MNWIRMYESTVNPRTQVGNYSFEQEGQSWVVYDRDGDPIDWLPVRLYNKEQMVDMLDEYQSNEDGELV